MADPAFLSLNSVGVLACKECRVLLISCSELRGGWLQVLNSCLETRVLHSVLSAA